jgi:hypothetical protein
MAHGWRESADEESPGSYLAAELTRAATGRDILVAAKQVTAYPAASICGDATEREKGK